jgi:hypothetical protein
MQVIATAFRKLTDVGGDGRVRQPDRLEWRDAAHMA